jgi:hypothetical protein
LFTIDIDKASDFNKEEDKSPRNAVYADDCIEDEDLSSVSSEEMAPRQPKQVEVLTR